MKTITRLFLVGLIALGMTACSNEDEVKFEGQAESTVSIKVVPSSNGPVVRAVGDLSDGVSTAGLAAESAIKLLEVFIFHGETPDGYGYAEGGLEVKDIPTHSGDKTIYVVANAGTKIGPIGTKSELQDYLKDLPVANVATNGLLMTAEPITSTLVTGKNQYGYASGDISFDSGANNLSGSKLPLTRVNARVAITSAKLELTELGPNETQFFDGLKDIEVAMFNVPKTSKLFGGSLVTAAPTYLQGDKSWPTTKLSYTEGSDEVTFSDVIANFPIENTAAAQAVYYYVNEHTPVAEYAPDATTPVANDKMLIVLRGKPILDNAEVAAEGLYTTNGYTYYPIWVNIDGTITGNDGAKDGKILRNTQYNISLTIKGIGNPTIDPVQNAFLDVLVSVEDWKVVEQVVEW